MYDDVYEAVVDCGVASKLQQPTYMDRDGNTTTNMDKAFGLPCTHAINHPDMCLVVDEVGSNLSQKGDGHIAGRKVMCEKNTTPQEQVQHKEKHFSLLGFTSLNGEPVLSLFIIAGIREEFCVETGIDPTAISTGDTTDEDFFDKNFGPGKLYPGGPTCTFKGKDIPCMVMWSPKGGITSPI